MFISFYHVFQFNTYLLSSCFVPHSFPYNYFLLYVAGSIDPSLCLWYIPTGVLKDMVVWGRWSKITEEEVRVLWHSTSRWNSIMVGLEMFLIPTFHVFLSPAMINSTWKVFLSLAFITHWSLLKFLSVALYKESVLGFFNFSSDILRIQAAEPWGPMVWMPHEILLFPHRYCLLLVAVLADDILVLCLSVSYFWRVCTKGIILFSLVISWVLAIPVIARCRLGIREWSPGSTASLLSWRLSVQRWIPRRLKPVEGNMETELHLVGGSRKAAFFSFFNSRSF